jgi:hypothetical protein
MNALVACLPACQPCGCCALSLSRVCVNLFGSVPFRVPQLHLGEAPSPSTRTGRNLQCLHRCENTSHCFACCCCHVALCCSYQPVFVYSGHLTVIAATLLTVTCFACLLFLLFRPVLQLPACVCVQRSPDRHGGHTSHSHRVPSGEPQPVWGTWSSTWCLWLAFVEALCPCGGLPGHCAWHCGTPRVQHGSEVSADFLVHYDHLQHCRGDQCAHTTWLKGPTGRHLPQAAWF